jgi:glycine/D-amino acid oxidase-like deaminating enzyme
MQVDYIIVGLGLAGLAFAEELSQNNKSFIVFENDSQRSSLVAAGVYNPIVLKRFNAVWNVQEQLKIALPFYKTLEKKLHNKYDQKIDIHRVFTSVEEQNNWFAATDKPVLSDYMHPKIIKNSNIAINAPFGFGRLSKTGRIETEKLIKDYRTYLSDKGKLKKEEFKYDLIQLENDIINYKGIIATKIVFCEGFGLKKNPYFKDLPMEEAKGELLTIHAPKLKLDVIMKASIFIQPLENDLYKIGATFNWDDKTSKPTEGAKKELLDKLDAIINVDYKVVDHVAGIRPTTRDRRPLVGLHKKHTQLAILNGLGTRGVILAPSMAKNLYECLEHQKPLSKEISIDRF